MSYRASRLKNLFRSSKFNVQCSTSPPHFEQQIKATREEIFAALHWAQSIFERRNTMSILANALINAQKPKIQLATTDLEVGVWGEVNRAEGATLNLER